MSDYAPGWVTHGYGRMPNSHEWIELGADKDVVCYPPALPPELGLHDVAAKLNELEAEIARLKEKP